MSFRLSISPVDLRRSKSHRATHSTSHPSKQHPETSSPKEKPLPTTPKISTVILHHLTPQRRRDSIALPRVIERWNRGIARVRRHSLIAGAGLSLKTPSASTTADSEIAPGINTKPITSSFPSEHKLETNTRGSREGDIDIDIYGDEEAELGMAVEMTIFCVRARLVCIGCIGLES